MHKMTMALSALTLTIAAGSAQAQPLVPGDLLMADALMAALPTNLSLPIPSDPGLALAALTEVGGSLLADPAPLVGLLTNTGVPFAQDQLPVLNSVLSDPQAGLEFILVTGQGLLPL